ncbi:MAG: 30S ribosomal protein S20 [Rhodobiaceae bacterium]|jgi:small subunit ribosomal protein S20|nr:30S ribosomal protein S20 [Rhodobiaceae bacterium]MBT7280244.1 30S ribosomal protein S20 [Rhodobiaceae bacterium]MDG2496405.1 30S ribosomal protein S20 [Alphaproteobacteria bacterium]
MANTKSAKKMVRKIERRTERNRDQRSRMRTFIRRVEEAVVAGNKDEAVEALRIAQPAIAKAGQKGLMHKRTASRKVSRLSKSVSAIV